MANVIFFHGEKGGIGKSTALIWALDNILMAGREDVGVIEADNVRDIKARYDKAGIVREAPLEAVDDESRLGGLMRLFETAAEMANEGKKLIFVNLPGRASIQLDPNAELMQEAMEEEGLKCTVVFVADADDHSKHLFESSMKSGLMSIADKKVVVLNLRHGSNPQAWPIMKSKVASDEIYEMPRIDPTVWESVKSIAAPVAIMAQDKDISVLKRNVLKRWIRSSGDLATLLQEVDS